MKLESAKPSEENGYVWESGEYYKILQICGLDLNPNLWLRRLTRLGLEGGLVKNGLLKCMFLFAGFCDDLSMDNIPYVPS